MAKRVQKNTVTQLLHTKKKNRRVKRLRVFFVLFIIGMIFYYFGSHYSRIQTITISGNQYITDHEIMKASLLVENKSFDLFSLTSSLKERILEVEGVKEVKIQRNYIGTLSIEVVEEQIIGYQSYEQEVALLMENGSVVFTTLDKVSIGNYVSTKNFTKERIIAFNEQFHLIPVQVRNLISDVAYMPENADETRCEFYMNDGKVVIVRIEDMASQLAGDNYAKMIRLMPDNKYYDLLGKYSYIFD